MVTKTYLPSNLCDSSYSSDISDSCDRSDSSDSIDSSASSDSGASSDRWEKNHTQKKTYFFYFFTIFLSNKKHQKT